VVDAAPAARHARVMWAGVVPVGVAVADLAVG